LLLLIVAQLGALTVNRMISTRLVEQRIAPMSQLQTIATAYQTSWAIADKVRIGTIDATGGATALRDIQAGLGAEWRELDAAAPEIAGQFSDERPDADKALDRLQTLLEANDHDRLDFFLSGQFFGGVDPLLGRIARATEELKATATQDRAVLRWVNFAAELLLLAVTIGAIAGGTLIAHLGETRLVRPLAAIAEHLRRTQRDTDEGVPGTDRHDEIGAIAQALTQADALAQQAERARQEQQRAEEALRHSEQEEAMRRRELEEALHARELEEARAGQARARLIDSHFARFDAVLSQLVSALGSASTTMRDMATTLASTSAQSRDMADSVAHSVSAAAARIDEVQRESLGLLTLVTDVRGSAATTRTHSGEVIEQSGHNRAQAQALSELVGGISRALGRLHRRRARDQDARDRFQSGRRGDCPATRASEPHRWRFPRQCLACGSARHARGRAGRFGRGARRQPGKRQPAHGIVDRRHAQRNAGDHCRCAGSADQIGRTGRCRTPAAGHGRCDRAADRRSQCGIYGAAF